MSVDGGENSDEFSARIHFFAAGDEGQMYAAAEKDLAGDCATRIDNICVTGWCKAKWHDENAFGESARFRTRGRFQHRPDLAGVFADAAERRRFTRTTENFAARDGRAILRRRNSFRRERGRWVGRVPTKVDRAGTIFRRTAWAHGF